MLDPAEEAPRLRGFGFEVEPLAVTAPSWNERTIVLRNGSLLAIWRLQRSAGFSNGSSGHRLGSRVLGGAHIPDVAASCVRVKGSGVDACPQRMEVGLFESNLRLQRAFRSPYHQATSVTEHWQ